MKMFDEALVEAVARAICRSQVPSCDPDAIVEWGVAMNGPKGSRVLMPKQQCKAWELFCHEAVAALDVSHETKALA